MLMICANEMQLAWMSWTITHDGRKKWTCIKVGEGKARKDEDAMRQI